MFERLMFMYGLCYEAPTDSGAGGEQPEGGKPEVKTLTSPKEEFRQLAAELKQKVEGLNNGETEQRAAIDKINEKLNDLEFDLEKVKKSKITTEKHVSSESLADFKSAFWRFAKGDRHGINAQIAPEVKSYHNRLPSEEAHQAYSSDRKNINMVRFDIASAGALLLPDEISTAILNNIQETTPVMGLVRTTQTSSPRKVRTLRVGTPGIRWLEEAGQSQKGKPTWRNVVLTPKKAAASYGMSIEQEQDSAHDLVAEINQAYREDFEVGVGTAVVNGDGVGKPKGMVGSMSGFNSVGQTITANMLIKMQEFLLDAYQQNGQWLFTRGTRSFIRQLFLTSNNAALQYLWEPDFTRRTPTVLLGAPINIAREGDLPSPNPANGTFSVAQTPVLFGDFDRGYELTMRTDMYIIDDPYSESDHFIRNFHIMSRVDGQPIDTNAVAELNITSA